MRAEGVKPSLTALSEQRLYRSATRAWFRVGDLNATVILTKDADRRLSLPGIKMEPRLRIELRSSDYRSLALPLSYQGVEPKGGYDPPSERYECSILPIELLRH